MRAELTVGADGLHSRVAQAVRASTYEYTPALSCWYFSYWSDVPMQGIELRLKQQRAVFAFPTSDDLTAVFVAFPIEDFSRVRVDPETGVLDARTTRPSSRSASVPDIVKNACMEPRMCPTSCAKQQGRAGR